MKKHVMIGENVLQGVMNRFKVKQSFLVQSRNITATHHEKFVGNGYFTKLKKTKIPLEARIFSLCDVYDAIRSKRSYKDELPHEEAVKRIIADNGKYFDPDIVNAFLNCEKEFVKVYKNFRMRPSVTDHFKHEIR